VLSQIGVYAGQTNVASLKSVTGSGAPNGSAFHQIVDGNFGDRGWQNGLCLYAPNQWAQVDLGGPVDISRVVVVLPDRYEGLPLLHHYKLHFLDANHVERHVVDFSEAARSGNSKRVYTFATLSAAGAAAAAGGGGGGKGGGGEVPEAPASVFASVASFLEGFVKRS